MLNIILIILICVLLIYIFYNFKKARVVSVVIDKDALVDDRISDIFQFIKNIKINIIVPSFIIKEFEKMIESGKMQDWEIGNKAIENFSKLKEFKFLNVKIDKTKFNKKNSLNDNLIKLVKKYNSYLITANFELYLKANIENLKIINIKYIEDISKKIIAPGHILKVFVSEKQGKKGISYFADSTKIIIDEINQSFLKKNVLCQVYKVTKNMDTKILNAKFLHLEE